jgi:hypothetical protein
MSTFDKREDQFEKQFVHDADLQFKVAARRNKLLGHWAATLMGLEGQAAEDYAKSVVVADLAEAGDEDVFAKIRGDLDAKGIAQSDHQIRRTMEELFAAAKLQIQNEG